MMLTCKRNQEIVKKFKEDLLNIASAILNFIFKKDAFATMKVNYKKLALNRLFHRLWENLLCNFLEALTRVS